MIQNSKQQMQQQQQEKRHNSSWLHLLTRLNPHNAEQYRATLGCLLHAGGWHDSLLVAEKKVWRYHPPPTVIPMLSALDVIIYIHCVIRPSHLEGGGG